MQMIESTETPPMVPPLIIRHVKQTDLVWIPISEFEFVYYLTN